MSNADARTGCVLPVATQVNYRAQNGDAVNHGKTFDIEQGLIPFVLH